MLKLLFVPTTASRALFVLWAVLLSPTAVLGAPTGKVTLAWDLSWEPNMAGYRLHYGSQSGSYDTSVDVGYVIQAELTGLTKGATYYCSVTAYNTFGLESDYSEEISFTVPDPPDERDSDGDGLSDLFEESFAGGGDLDPLSDLDGDGLSALSEFFHGLNPTSALTRPILDFEVMEIAGERYLCLRYHVDPKALDFVEVQVERRTDLNDPDGWKPDETVELSSGPSAEFPGLREVLERSISPMSAQRMEFIRFRHQVLQPPG